MRALHETVWFLLVGLVAGWLAGVLTTGKGFGLAGNLVIGVLGALIGGFLFQLLPPDFRAFAGSLSLAVVGAVVLLYLLSWVGRR